MCAARLFKANLVPWFRRPCGLEDLLPDEVF
jgi:hypothetical protein